MKTLPPKTTKMRSKRKVKAAKANPTRRSRHPLPRKTNSRMDREENKKDFWRYSQPRSDYSTQRC